MATIYKGLCLSAGVNGSYTFYMEVIYIRHGESLSNIEQPGLKAGSDLPLTPEGVRQVHATGRLLAELAISGAVGPLSGIIYASPYKRTLATAHIVASYIDGMVKEDDRLKEIQKGFWHGEPVRDVIQYEAEVRPDEEYAFRPPGGENWFEVAHRMVEVVDEHEKRGDASLVVVSHDFPIEAAIGAKTGLPARRWKDYPVDVASISRIDNSGGDWMIDSRIYNVKGWS